MPKSADTTDPDLLTLARSVDALERRVAALEHVLMMVAPGALPPGVPQLDPEYRRLEQPSKASPQGFIVTRLGLIGRTLIVLGGAYLLRALTEAAVLPLAIGVAAGLVYALIWLAYLTRSAAQGDRAGGAFHGLTAALVAFPLIWEATARFALLPAPAGAVLLGAFSAAMLVVAARSRIEAVAWFASLGAAATCLALAVATRSFASYTILLVLLGIATVWLGYLREWVLIRWPLAGAVDLMTLALAIRAVDPDVPSAVGPTVALLLFPVVAYLGSFVSRTIFLGRDLVPFEVAQSAAVMLAGFGGALAALRAAQASAVPLGTGILILAAACYAFAFVVVEPRRHWRNYAFYTGLAVALTAAGVCLTVPGYVMCGMFVVLAILAVEAARRSSRLALALHGLIYAAAAAVVSGLWLLGCQALAGSARSAWHPIDWRILAAFAAMVAVTVWPRPQASPGWVNEARALRLTRSALLVWATSAVAVALLAPVLSGVPGRSADPGTVATIRTVVLVAALFGVLVLQRRQVVLEWTWLAYGLLAVIGMKFVTDDLLHSRPATLFLALALYGIALVVTPRMSART